MNPRLADVKSNLKKIENLIKKDQKENRSDVVVFPELATSGYLLENLIYDAALKTDDLMLEPIKELSLKTEIILGALIQEDSLFYNAALVFSNGKLIYVQKKIYLPTYGMFDESRYYSRGRSLNVYEGKAGKTGILICEDAWHPVLAYRLAKEKAESVFVLSASPARGFGNETFDSNEMWIARMRVYAQSYGAQYFYINRSGFEDGVYFKGQSLFASPDGVFANDFLEDDESSLLEIDTAGRHSSIRSGGPFLEEDFDLNEKILNEAP